MEKEGAEKPRWQYRLDNFGRAYVLLSEGVDRLVENGLTQLEQEGLIQRFEYTWELAWNTIADYLAYQGIVVAQSTPRVILRTAFERGVIDDGEEWMAALDARNKMSHTYNFKVFERVIEQIRDRFLRLFSDLYQNLTAQVLSR